MSFAGCVTVAPGRGLYVRDTGARETRDIHEDKAHGVNARATHDTNARETHDANARTARDSRARAARDANTDEARDVHASEARDTNTNANKTCNANTSDARVINMNKTRVANERNARGTNTTHNTNEAVLLLHGFTGTGESLRVLRPAFGARRVLAVDLLGHGRSDAPAQRAPYEMEHCVADLCALLDARRVSRAHVFGYSLGARVALGLACFAPARVASVMALGARAGLANARARAARVWQDEALAREIETRGLRWFADYWAALPLFATQRRLAARVRMELRQQRLANRARGLAMSLRGIGLGAQPPLDAALAAQPRPLLLLAGALDPRFCAEAARLARLAPNARARTLPDAGHAAHLENPTATARACREFLAEQGT